MILTRILSGNQKTATGLPIPEEDPTQGAAGKAG